MTGRKLDQDTETNIIEGETSNIFVSRNSLLETGFSEILELEKFDVPLEVTFYGEEAMDYGGPRKEFFNLMMQEMVKEEFTLFEKDEQLGVYDFKLNEGNIVKNWYYASGVLCG